MLLLTFPEVELFDERTSQFLSLPEERINIEHSLASLSKWESKWQKPFLSKEDRHKKTPEENLDYMYCMCLTPPADQKLFDRLTVEQATAIGEYIASSQTATWFAEVTKKTSTTIVTAEVMYSWLVGLNIPMAAETWHLNKFITLVRVINEQNTSAMSDKKSTRSRKEMVSERQALNRQRRSKYNSKG